MKKTLTVLCLMIAAAGAGQEIKPFDPANPKYKIDSVVAPKYDTIPIIYLYADTARLMSIGEGWYIKGNVAFIEIDTSYYPPHFYAFWDFGYEVRETKPIASDPFWHCSNCPKYYTEHIGYLDRQKNPIRKGIIIFNVKNIQ